MIFFKKITWIYIINSTILIDDFSAYHKILIILNTKETKNNNNVLGEKIYGFF